MSRAGTTAVLALTATLTLAGCGEEEPDAYGNFEAIEVVVSAELSGQLVKFSPEKGQHIVAGTLVGQIDTTSLALQRRELLSTREAAQLSTTAASAQTDVLRAQLATAEEEYQRTLRLFRAEAATSRALNLAEGEVRVLRERIEATRAESAAADEQATSVAARVEQINDRIRQARIVNPITGTVLATYAEAGEFVQPGQPLYEIADLSPLILRAYVSGSQLSQIRIGQEVRVQIDGPEGELLALPGRISWISSEVEFTPTPIQTRDERTDQVYAIEIRVPNPNGIAKIGMPGEVVFADSI
ncbi:MAG TPA: HlyD family efflux transporter periplasmic adaptor subunit [Longimicrobiaceae bacterium]|nr:HlyD family efflux transporter periplasmic adaptor subunit [Longimicrobiaceae bacterium]